MQKHFGGLYAGPCTMASCGISFIKSVLSSFARFIRVRNGTVLQLSTSAAPARPWFGRFSWFTGSVPASPSPCQLSFSAGLIRTVANSSVGRVVAILRDQGSETLTPAVPTVEAEHRQHDVTLKQHSALFGPSIDCATPENRPCRNEKFGLPVF